MLEGIQKTYLLESNGFTVEVSLSEKYDILENASSVSVGLRVKSAYKRGIQYLSGSIKIDGKTLLVMDSTISTHNVQVADYNTWYNVVRSSDRYTDSPWTMENIIHDTEGAKDIAFEMEMRGYGQDNYLSLRVATTKTIALTKIPRASTVAAADANIGAVSMVSVVRSVASYTHSIAYGFGSLSGYLRADGSVGASEVKLSQTSIPFLLPESFYDQIPNASTGECTLTIRTYRNSQQIGNAQTASFTVTASKKLCKPVISGSVEDINPKTLALTGDKNILVRYASNALCSLSATAKNGASIASKTIGGVKTTANTLTIEQTQTDTVAFACRDSRGYEASAEVKKKMVPYIPLSAGISAARTDPTSGKVKLVVSGMCYCGNFGVADNTLTVVCAVNNGDPIEVEAAFDGNDYTAETVLSGLDYQRAHTVSVTVADKLQSVTKSVKVGKGIPVFDWDEDDFQFHVPVGLGDGCDILKNGKVAYIPAGENRVFVKLANVGITTFPTTMKTVANAMPNNSVLMLDSRDILSGGANEISDLGLSHAGMYIFFSGNNVARLSLLHIYGATSATTSYMNFGCYASTTNQVLWIRGERQNNSYPDCRYRVAEDGSVEYINPPMKAGNEYRTTERWEGKPVYRKLLVCTTAVDMVGNTTTTFAHGISGLDVSSARLEITTYFSKYDDNNGASSAWIMPYTSLNTNENLFVSKISDTQITLRSEGGANWDEGRTFYFTMKYCKK